MCNLFAMTSQLTSRNLRNSATDLKIPKKNSKNEHVSLLEVVNLGMAFQLSIRRHPKSKN